MYKLKRENGYWCLSDIARYIGHDPKIAARDLNKRGFPKPVIIGVRRYWKEMAVRRFYESKNEV